MRLQLHLLALGVALLALPAGAQPADTAARLQEAREAVVRREPQQALRIWTELARAGDAEAQYQLGVQYDSGRWIGKDSTQAAHWFQAAAEQNHARAQYNLARLYADGDGVARDAAQARRWRETGRPCDVMVDTGINRLGLLPADLPWGKLSPVAGHAAGRNTGPGASPTWS